MVSILRCTICEEEFQNNEKVFEYGSGVFSSADNAIIIEESLSMLCVECEDMRN